MEKYEFNFLAVVLLAILSANPPFVADSFWLDIVSAVLLLGAWLILVNERKKN